MIGNQFLEVPLKYNPKLVEAMLRPIVKYAKSKEWPYEFVPHDACAVPTQPTVKAAKAVRDNFEYLPDVNF